MGVYKKILCIGHNFPQPANCEVSHLPDDYISIHDNLGRMLQAPFDLIFFAPTQNLFALPATEADYLAWCESRKTKIYNLPPGYWSTPNRFANSVVSTITSNSVAEIQSNINFRIFLANDLQFQLQLLIPSAINGAIVVCFIPADFARQELCSNLLLSWLSPKIGLTYSSATTTRFSGDTLSVDSSQESPDPESILALSKAVEFCKAKFDDNFTWPNFRFLYNGYNTSADLQKNFFGHKQWGSLFSRIRPDSADIDNPGDVGTENFPSPTLSAYKDMHVWVVPGHVDGLGNSKSIIFATGKGALILLLSPPTNEYVDFFHRIIDNPPPAHQVSEMPNEFPIAHCRECKSKIESILKKLNKQNPLIGESEAILRLYPQILRAYNHPETHVLMHGETGTGKGMLYKLIKLLSDCTDNQFREVSVQGTNIDSLKSEIFGHTKGSFTGAANARPGQIELAAGGTLVLDNLQAGTPEVFNLLLRVLEPEQTYSRLGSSKIEQANCRIIGGLSTPVKELIDNKIMPPDFSARFPIHIEVPRLHDRISDIPLLISHFVAEQLKDPKNRYSRVQIEPPAAKILEWQLMLWKGSEYHVRGLKSSFTDYVSRTEQSLPKTQVGRPRGRSFSDVDFCITLRAALQKRDASIVSIVKQLNTVHNPKIKMKPVVGALTSRISRVVDVPPEILKETRMDCSDAWKKKMKNLIKQLPSQ